MVIPCLCLFRFSSCHHKKSTDRMIWRSSFSIDIPRRWEPRTNQQPHWGFDCLRCARHVLFESCTVRI